MRASTLVLRGGACMPILGLGMFRIPPGPTAYRAVERALALGYRAIDTAASYRNEGDVGRAIRGSGISRKDLFVTTKLPAEAVGRDAVRRELEESLRRLGVDALDLLLLHWPTPERRHETWEALVEARREGLCRAIGVSNFERRHLDDICATGVPPEVDQIEAHPFLPRAELFAHCAALGIVVTAYAPLTRGARLHDPRLVELAVALRVTPAELLIAWGLERGTAVVVGSMNEARMATNLRAQQLSVPPDVMHALARLEDGYRVSWDPSEVP